MNSTSLPAHESAVNYLIRHLAGGNERKAQLLLDWMAEPLQHPYTKLPQGLLLHGYAQTGTYLLAETLEDVYHQAATRVFSQRLRGPLAPFTPYTQLLTVFHDDTDLDVGTDRKPPIRSILKQLVSAPELQLNRSPGHEETCTNRMNVVFVSGSVNFLDDSNDRRWMVVHAKNKLQLSKSDDRLLSFSQRLERALALKNILLAHRLQRELEAV